MKSKILQTLHQDHANLIQLLSLIESETGKLEKMSCEASFEILSLALEYCTDFPSYCHHPKEDLIYAKLSRREPEIAKQIADLEEDHKTLNSLTRAVTDEIAAAISGDGTEKLRETVNRFVRHYRYHIGIEETEVFPCARRALTDADWQAIEDAYADSRDSLFGEHTRDAYIALQQCIVDRAASPH